MTEQKENRDANRLDRHTARLLALHVWCHQSSDNVPSTSQLSILATEDFRAGSTGTCDQELQGHLVDFVLVQYKYTVLITIPALLHVNNIITLIIIIISMSSGDDRIIHFLF